MNDHQVRKPSDTGQNSDTQLEHHEQTLSEQTMTPASTTLAVAIVRGADKSSFSTSFHWTVRLKVTEMNDRTTSILLKVLVAEQLARGIDFTGYIAVEYLCARLQRGKASPEDIYEEKDRQALLLGTLILASVRGTWQNLQERIPVPLEVVRDILATGWLPSVRTLKSWKEYHQPRRFLEILTVPMEDFIENWDRVGSRYSSYCKGYGNGGHLSRTKKTRYDSETDGESTDREPPSINLLEIEQYNQLLLSIEREKIARRSES